MLGQDQGLFLRLPKLGLGSDWLPVPPGQLGLRWDRPRALPSTSERLLLPVRVNVLLTLRCGVRWDRPSALLPASPPSRRQTSPTVHL